MLEINQVSPRVVREIFTWKQALYDIEIVNNFIGCSDGQINRANGIIRLKTFGGVQIHYIDANGVCAGQTREQNKLR